MRTKKNPIVKILWAGYWILSMLLELMSSGINFSEKGTQIDYLCLEIDFRQLHAQCLTSRLSLHETSTRGMFDIGVQWYQRGTLFSFGFGTERSKRYKHERIDTPQQKKVRYTKSSFIDIYKTEGFFLD